MWHKTLLVDDQVPPMKQDSWMDVPFRPTRTADRLGRNCADRLGCDYAQTGWAVPCCNNAQTGWAVPMPRQAGLYQAVTMLRRVGLWLCSQPVSHAVYYFTCNDHTIITTQVPWFHLYLLSLLISLVPILLIPPGFSHPSCTGYAFVRSCTGYSCRLYFICTGYLSALL